MYTCNAALFLDGRDSRRKPLDGQGALQWKGLEVKIERATSDGLSTLTPTISIVGGTSPYAKISMALRFRSLEIPLPLYRLPPKGLQLPLFSRIRVVLLRMLHSPLFKPAAKHTVLPSVRFFRPCPLLEVPCF